MLLRLFTWIKTTDRALFVRMALTPASRASHRWGWLAVTQLGEAYVTVTACLVPVVLGDRATRHAAWTAAWSLALTALFIQLVKRRAVRDRPATPHDGPPLARIPDKFSFPSGHSGAVMTLACAYALAAPPLAVPLLLLAVLVGLSRVRLGVHYPGDVLAGLALGAVTALGVSALMR